MQILLISLLALVTIINCNDICKEDGLFRNSGDRTSYYECANGKSHFRRCPVTENGLSYMVFDGKECVELYPSFVCPQESGNYRYGNSETQYYECADSEPILRNCLDNSKFDGLECVKLDTLSEVIKERTKEEFICPSSTGVYPNPDDRHSYYECVNSIPRLKFCPIYMLAHLWGAQRKHRRRMIWDGHQCVQINKLNDNRSARQAPLDRNYRFTCPEPNGKFPNAVDSHYYYQCENNIPRPAVCPRNTLFNLAERECMNSLNNVIPRNVPVTYPIRNQVSDRVNITCPSATVYDPRTGKCQREDFADPITEGQPVIDPGPQCPAGTVYDVSTDKCRGEDLTSPIEVRVEEQTRPQCPVNTVYDSPTGKCKQEILVDPIRNVVVQPQIYPPTCPDGSIYDVARGQCVRLTSVDPLPRVRTCQAGYRWDASLGRCESSGNYRRNGRVEMEDSLNGAVIVDTWNELQWRWDRNHNGNRVLTDVNGWLDRSQSRVNENNQHARNRPVQNIN